MTTQRFNLPRRHALTLLAAGVAVATRAQAQESSANATALGRFHTDFVQSQVAPGRVLGDNNSQPGVKGDALSYNAKGDKAVTVIFRYPANWSMPKPHYVNSDQEFYILDGSVNFDGTLYQAGDYAYLPAGYHHGLMQSENGCTMLNFYEGEHLAFYEPTPEGMYKADRLIKKIETGKMKWAPAKGPAFDTLGAKPHIKILRTDKTTGETTYLVKVNSDAADKPISRYAATHQAVEEMYLIDGEISSPRGTLKTGAYVWRAPGTPRGPLGSKTGFVALIRSKGGALETKRSDEKLPVVWNAPYEPVIADNARTFAFKTYDAGQRY
ncbi:MAG: cupin domain-containing protein [Rhodospirillaceae bacterium]|nr:cupin domain-containing protein [Rhodospirillaceae bacterium]